MAKKLSLSLLFKEKDLIVSYIAILKRSMIKLTPYMPVNLVICISGKKLCCEYPIIPMVNARNVCDRANSIKIHTAGISISLIYGFFALFKMK